jgi:hypothetical protein
MCIKMITGQWGYVCIYIMDAIQVIFFCIFVLPPFQIISRFDFFGTSNLLCGTEGVSFIWIC